MSTGLRLEALLDDSKYTPDLINSLIEGDLKILETLGSKRNSVDYMRDLIYAIKENHGTYEGFLYAGASVQSNPTIANVVFRAEPQLIQKTFLCRDPEFIKNNIASCPEIAKYIDSSLRNNPVFVEMIREETGIKIDSLVAKSYNNIMQIEALMIEKPELRESQEFIAEAIKTDVSVLKYAAQSIRNNFDFLREQSAGNNQVIDFVAENIEDFGLDGISAVSESSKEITTQDTLAQVELNANTSEDIRFRKVADFARRKGSENPCVLRATTAMLTKTDIVSPEIMQEVMSYSTLAMETVRQGVNQEGKMNFEISTAQKLIRPQILNSLLDRADKLDPSKREHFEELIERYTEFYNSYQEQFKEYKREHRAELLAAVGYVENAEEKQSDNISYAGVKNAVDGVSAVEMGEVNREITVNYSPEKPSPEKLSLEKTGTKEVEL